MAALAAIFEVVMDRVIIGRDCLKGGEMCFGPLSARGIKPLGNRPIAEIAGLPKAVPVALEAQAHNAPLMKHADAAALAALCDVIENLRRRPVLVEKKLGIFYTKGRA